MKICVAVDWRWPRERSDIAVSMARRLAGRQEGARILLLTVVREGEEGEAAGMLKNAWQEEEACILVGKSAGEALVRFADSFAPHMLVVGTRAQESSFLESMLLGSTSSYVLERAECAVMVAR